MPMAAAATTFNDIKNQIAKGKLAPVYVLHGEEGYYTDVLVRMMENALAPDEKEFNQYILYAPETNMMQVADLCRRFPMLADRQMVIVKEMQSARVDDINRLQSYLLNPVATTVLVLVFRGAEAKGKEFMAAARKSAVIFESKKVRDYQLLPLIDSYVRERGMTVDTKAAEMLRDFIGTDLSRLYNEIDKLSVLPGTGGRITPDVVERNIGISKDFNNFELIEAIAARDARKSMAICKYFNDNPSANPLAITVASLYGFYSDLLIALYTKDKSDAGLVKSLGAKNEYAIRKFKTAMRLYNARQVIECIWALRQFDTRSKGVGSRQNASGLFQDLIFHLLTARGDLGV